METNTDPRDSIIDRVTHVLDVLASIERDLPLALDCTADPADSSVDDALEDIESIIEILVERFEINRVDPNHPHNDIPDVDADVPNPVWNRNT
jgi:hypothetical protein